MSMMTKKALAASLKKLMETKPLSKITVTDITEDCGMNRHTFYYHFQDIYDLLEWIFSSEAEKVLDGRKTHETWQEGVRALFAYASGNKKFILGTYRSLRKEDLVRYFYREMLGLVEPVVEEMAGGLHVAEKQKMFVAGFYTSALLGIVVRWFEGDMKEDPEEIMSQLFQMIQGDFREALERLSEKK